MRLAAAPPRGTTFWLVCAVYMDALGMDIQGMKGKSGDTSRVSTSTYTWRHASSRPGLHAARAVVLQGQA